MRGCATGGPVVRANAYCLLAGRCLEYAFTRSRRVPGRRTTVRLRPMDDSTFGRIVVEKHLATREEVLICANIQKELQDKGQATGLSKVMVDNGYLTNTQVRRLNSPVDEDSMYRPAQQIPGFQILGKLGQGAMATVFKAKQLSLDRIVAIKVLPKRLSENPEFVERFYREGRAAARLNHNNIVQAIDVGEAGGYHYFVMEYIDGKTVYDNLVEGARGSEKEALDVIIQVAQALEHAHERGFIHRDVKPKNIMLTEEGVVKLADMGLAREISDYKAATEEAGRAFGTPYYISPEQIRGEIDIDCRADLYSLGATFYHIVTGRVPFEGSTPAAVMHKHLKEPLIPPDHVSTSLSAGVGEVIEVMMAKKRDQRYSNATDLLLDLEAVANGEPPFQARRKYDDQLLQDLATKGEVVEEHTQAELDLATRTGALTNWLIVLAIVLGLSIIGNVLLLLMG